MSRSAAGSTGALDDFGRIFIALTSAAPCP
jgi:hypothetical protein